MITKLCRHARRPPCDECAEEKRARERGRAGKRTRGPKGVQLRAATRRRYGHRCAALVPTRCTTVVGLEMHHVNGDPTDDRPENLVCLCREHHRQISAGATFDFAKPTAELPFIGT